MKVYCKNCKYLEHWTSQWEGAFSEDRCSHYKNITVKHCAMTSYESYDRDIEEINLLNDCNWYERKWWKFWIKENK
jgi:hypothetical protein